MKTPFFKGVFLLVYVGEMIINKSEIKEYLETFYSFCKEA